MQYGKLEVPDIDFVEGEIQEEIKFTILDFSPIMEFKVDKMYTILTKSLKGCDDCGFDTDTILEKTAPDYLLKVVEWTRANIVEAKELTLMECFYMFINFFTYFSYYRNDIKKKSTQSLMDTSDSSDAPTV